MQNLPAPVDSLHQTASDAGRVRAVRLLLVYPKAPESFWSFRWAVRNVLSGKSAVNPPLGLATLAALCPAHWRVTIVDENVEPLPLAPAADLIGIAGMGVQFPRQSELLAHYRAAGYFVVAGGSYASLCPERYADLADSVICGEAEYIWPRFCRDFERGEALPLYRETGTVELADSPTPRFELLKLDRYTTATLQFSRGCPYLCEFCDIIVMFGRRPRHKTLAQIGRELDRLRALEVRDVFFVDDNLIGNPRAAMGLLRFLKEYQERHGHAFRFGTEVSLNLAQDPALMSALRAANFAWVFIGIESPDEQSLRETRKLQNVREDPLRAVRRIYSHGIDVLAGFIVGFDNDTVDTFERQFEFILRSGIQGAMIGLLNALPRTPLHERLRLAGRLRDPDGECDNSKPATNVVPIGMTYEDLIAGYVRLHERLLTDAAIAERVVNKNRFLRRPAAGRQLGFAESLRLVTRLLARGLLPGGPVRVYRFVRSLPWRAPRNVPLAISDWITALSMRDYAARHFAEAATARAAVPGARVARIAAALSRCVGEGKVILRPPPSPTAGPALVLSLGVPGNARLLARIGRQLSALLRDTPSSLTLRLSEIRIADLPDVRRLLRQLARFGDRVSLEIGETLHGLAARPVTVQQRSAPRDIP